MANDLYDTGKPKRIVVEHQHIHHVIHGGRNDMEEETPPKKQKPVTITPEFQVVKEPKRLK